MRVKNLVLGVGIFIVYLLMLGYGIEAFYPSPQYDDYCPQTRFLQERPFNASAVCTLPPSVDAQEDACYLDGGQPVYDYDTNGCIIGLKLCDFCYKEFNDAQESYSRVLFFITLIAGIITIIVGYTLLSTEPVGSALMASGVGALVYGSIRNWSNLSDVWRFLLLAVVLVLLIWIALRFNKKQKPSKLPHHK